MTSSMLSTQSKPSKIFALVDCNSFYCSCERVFQPHLQNKPVIVLSNNDGCVVSRTDEAKAMGIPMAVPFFQVKDFCKAKGISVFSSNYTLYGDMSRRVMKVLSDLAPEMEIYSIDEAFLSLDGIPLEKLTAHAQQIKQKVEQYTGIPISIGIGSTKVLAKLANNLAKKNKIATQGVFNLFEVPHVEELFKNIPVQEIWGIGRKSAEKLRAAQIDTAWDLIHTNEQRVQKILTITGRRIFEELRGVSCLSLELLESDKKQIISSRSFGKPVFKKEDLREALARHISTASEKLRAQNCVTGSILVFIRTSYHHFTPQYYNSATISLISGSASTNKLIQAGFQGLEQIYREGFQYKKAGVVLMDIHPKAHTQLNLFGSHDTPRNEALMELIDRVNRRQGAGTLKFAACGTHPSWEMLSNMKSPQYSTRWNDLLQVN